MSSSVGPAELVTADGAVLGSVTVRLRSWRSRHELQDWSGSATGSDAVLGAAWSTGDVLIRLPNGRAGRVVISNYTIATPGPNQSLVVMGNGESPVD